MPPRARSRHTRPPVARRASSHRRGPAAPRTSAASRLEPRLCNFVVDPSNAEDVELAVFDLVVFLTRTYALLSNYIDDLELIARADRGQWDLGPEDDDTVWAERLPAPHP